jgi:hypothetical protein
MPKDSGTVFGGFRSPNYTMVPDELFDELLPVLTGSELKVLLYIIRRTFGFKKDADAISLSQMLHGIVTRDGRVLDHGVGIRDKKTLLAAIKSLEAQAIILTERHRSAERGDEPTTYRLNIIAAPPGGISPPGGGGKTPPGGGGEIPPALAGKPHQQRGGQIPPRPRRENPATQETVLQETALQKTVGQETAQQHPVVVAAANQKPRSAKKQAIPGAAAPLVLSEGSGPPLAREPVVPQEMPPPATTERPAEVLERLLAHGFSDAVARQLLARYSQTYLLEKLDYLAYLAQTAAGRVNVVNPRGWLRRALEEDYAPPDGYQTPAQREAATTQHEQWRLALFNPDPPRLTRPTWREWVVRTYEVSDALQTQTHQMQALLAQLLPAATYQELVVPVQLVTLDADGAVIAVPSARAYAWLHHRLKGRFEEALWRLLGRSVPVTFIVVEQPRDEP